MREINLFVNTPHGQLFPCLAIKSGQVVSHENEVWRKCSSYWQKSIAARDWTYTWTILTFQTMLQVWLLSLSCSRIFTNREGENSCSQEILSSSLAYGTSNALLAHSALQANSDMLDCPKQLESVCHYAESQFSSSLCEAGWGNYFEALPHCKPSEHVESAYFILWEYALHNKISNGICLLSGKWALLGLIACKTFVLLIRSARKGYG